LGEAELVGTYHWRNMNITTWLINRAESRYPPCVFWMRCYLFHYNHDLSHEDRLEWEDMISELVPCTRVRAMAVASSSFHRGQRSNNSTQIAQGIPSSLERFESPVSPRGPTNT
jgi:hypothetical protein